MRITHLPEAAHDSAQGIPLRFSVETVQVFHGQQAGLSSSPQFLPAKPARFGIIALQAGKAQKIEQAVHLLAKDVPLRRRDRPPEALPDGQPGPV